MKSLVIKCNKRIIINKFSLRFLRKINKIPCVLYGKNHKNIHFNLNEKKIKNIILNIGTDILVIELDYKISLTVRLQYIQFHPVNDSFLHADFYKIDTNSPLILNIPINLVGKSILLSQGGNIIEFFNKLKIKAYIYDFPDFIVVDISKYKIGDKIKVKEIKLNKNKYTILHNDNTVLFEITNKEKTDR
jgi:large subunit ribosomal protein L25